MAGITNDGIASTDIDSSNFSGTNVYAAVGSFSTGITTAILTTSAGTVESIVVGSGTTTTYGGLVRTGSLVTSAGSVGFVAVGLPFASSNYYVTMSPRSFVNGVGSVVPYTSGVKALSGVNIVGAASATYDFIAIGI